MSQDAKVKKLAKVYTDWHWGSPPDKLIHVRDALVPDLVGIGRLRSIALTDGREFEFAPGCWVGFAPDHPHQRIHLVLSPSEREKVRKSMKHAQRTWPIQEIARATGGTHAQYPLPSVRGAPVGIAEAIVYHTHKVGEEDDKAFDYEHTFGREHSRGSKPALVGDVSGRLWLVGGSYTCPLPGITG